MTELRIPDRLTASSGRHYVPGTEALVRLPLYVAQRDREAGLRTGVLISGHPGSPLGGRGLTLDREADPSRGHGVVHVPAGNEEQATTAGIRKDVVAGHPTRRRDHAT
ncbi:hypothetical protein [Modestobacter lapidis]